MRCKSCKKQLRHWNKSGICTNCAFTKKEKKISSKIHEREYKAKLKKVREKGW